MLGAAGPASAQLGRTPRAYRGLFDPAPKENSIQSLTVSGSLMGGYDTSVLGLGRGNSGSISASAVRGGGGYFGSATGSASYTLETKPARFFARASSSGRYFPKVHDWVTFQSVAAGTSLSVDPWAHGTWRFGSTVAYSTGDRLQLFDQPEGTDAFLDQQDYAVIGRRVVRYTVTSGVTQRFGQRSSVSVSGAARFQDRGGSSANYRKYSAGAEWSYRMSRDATAYLGYGYQQAEYLGAGIDHRPPPGQSMDGGVRYARGLSLTRKTAMSFSTGATFVRAAPFDQGEASNNQPLRAHMNGSAGLTHEIARSWYAQAAYVRNVRFLEEFTDPIMSDSVSGGISGYLGPRTDLSMVAAYARGSNAYRRRASSDFSTYTGSVQLRQGLIRGLSAYVQYLYYHYKFGEGNILLRDISSELDRQSVRFGISASVPLLR
jgi:hypothetical protein